MNAFCRFLLVLLTGLTLGACRPPGPSATPDYTRFVNPFIGTDGTGHTFPGPCRPFGLVQPGPDNVDQGWDYTSGYQYRAPRILGFSQTRASGTGISELGDVLLQPVTSDTATHFGQSYAKSTERASPGYYAVTLGNRVRVELASTERVALHRYTYPTAQARLLVDLQHGLRFFTDSLVLESAVRVENQRTISGYCHTKNWVERKYFFVISFNQPFTEATPLPRRPRDNAPRYLLRFALPDSTLLTKVALSTVSVAGARRNLQAELPGWDFAAVVAQSRQSWNQYLSRIEVTGSRSEKEVFYSCLYRLFIQPSNVVDVDGRYRGPDDSVRVAPHKAYYSTLSLWDTYRGVHPLYTLIAPERVDGFASSMLAHGRAAGFLPIWTIWGQENYCMIGNHALPVLADAYAKGFRGFSGREALRQMVQSTTENHLNSNWPLLNRYGYYPTDSLPNEAVSRTLEHGVDDYCVAQLAGQLGQPAVAATYARRAGYYRNLFDPATRLLRGRDSRGRWRTPFRPLEATSPMNNPGDYTEANAWQYFWTPAQYDVAGLTRLLGGRGAFTAQLDSFFSIRATGANKHLGQEALIGQYAHGNEPDQHVPYLYAYSDTPARGPALVARICREFYRNTPDGLTGNDDCGQMSAWYIFAVLGFYPVNPAAGDYVLGRPLVSRAVVHVGGGKTLTITRNNADHTGRISLNDTVLTTPTVPHQALVRGGARLVF
ncbi:GH92 family glycosyl hydrolase [Hymenobacter rigui]|uniref:Glycoside hydrolase family 92 protein n=1 Tax=Hymenobacter rigui TaxID=334424 RepID=A0A428KMC6_9BACT|nr:GH92 family glycosyl hydrolase [Hymenobacter rigui]RSK47527.1 glycoside hydrolase family 92 protein [Hymenobacter rigui]